MLRGLSSHRAPTDVDAPTCARWRAIARSGSRMYVAAAGGLRSEDGRGAAGLIHEPELQAHIQNEDRVDEAVE